MPIDYALYNTLLQGIQFKDPRLYDLLRTILDDLSEIKIEVFPEGQIEGEAIEEEEVTETTPDVLVFSYIINPDSLFLYWDSPDPTRIFSYEIREGATWEFGNRLIITPSLNADLPPQLIGDYVFWIKAISIDGGYSENPKQLEVSIPTIGPISITAQVVDNNVLLFWTEPESVFRIVTYEIYKGETFLGFSTGTFEAIFETSAGTYEYRIRARDLAGDYSPFASLFVTVATPPDYLLQDQRESGLDGDRINVGRTVAIPSILFNVNITETWEEHYVNNGFDSPLDQINAGFPVYAQPTPLTGTYTEVIDYGTVISNILVNIDYVRDVIIGSGHLLTFTLENSIVSDTGPWLVAVNGTNAFFAEIRWLKITIVGTAID